MHSGWSNVFEEEFRNLMDGMPSPPAAKAVVENLEQLEITKEGRNLLTAILRNFLISWVVFATWYFKIMFLTSYHAYHLKVYCKPSAYM